MSRRADQRARPPARARKRRRPRRAGAQRSRPAGPAADSPVGFSFPRYARDSHQRDGRCRAVKRSALGAVNDRTASSPISARRPGGSTTACERDAIPAHLRHRRRSAARAIANERGADRIVVHDPLPPHARRHGVASAAEDRTRTNAPASSPSRSPRSAVLGHKPPHALTPHPAPVQPPTCEQACLNRTPACRAYRAGSLEVRATASSTCETSVERSRLARGRSRVWSPAAPSGDCDQSAIRVLAPLPAHGRATLA